MYLLYYSTKGISRSDELENVLKTQRHFRSKHQGNCFDGVNIEIMEKGSLEQETRTYVFGIGSRIR
jgi:hypothetical protein